jgi:hypothetical protein
MWNWIKMENRKRDETIVLKNLLTNKMDWKETYSHYNTWLANIEKKSKKTADKLKLSEEEEFERKCLSYTELASFHVFILKLSVKQHKCGRIMARLSRVRYEILRALIMKPIFWNVSPHSSVELYRRFIQICCLQHQGRWIRPQWTTVWIHTLGGPRQNCGRELLFPPHVSPYKTSLRH